MAGLELGDVVPPAPPRNSLPDAAGLAVEVLTRSHRLEVVGPESTTVAVLSRSHRVVIITA